MSDMTIHRKLSGLFYGIELMPFTISDVEKHKKGLSDSQKRQWVEIANSVLNKCISDGGTESSCDGSAIRQANGAVNNNMEFIIQSSQLKSYSIRDEVHQDKDFLVVPVVMLVEGVHKSVNGGSVLHLLEEFSRLPEAWNGVPVTVNHPQNEDGIYISANTPEIIENQTIGIIYNTHIEDGKLKAEAWIEKIKTEISFPGLANTLLSGIPLEVSTGAFIDYQKTQGQNNGESYESIARGYIPNHLALLPNGKGACSWADGCGIRVHKEGGDELKKETKEAMKSLVKEGFSVIQCNELGFRETSSKIQSKLDAMDTDVKFHNLQEVFEDEFVFSMFTQTEENLFKRGYTVNADETIEFIGEPIPVTRKVEFVELNNNESEVNAMSKEKSKSCCPGKVHLLVSSGRFTEKSKVWLDELNESALDELLSDKEKLQVNRADALEVLKEDLSSPEKLVVILSGDAKTIVEHGLALNQEERKKLVDHITANAATEGGLSVEELNAKDTDELEKLAAMVKASSDFTGINSGNQNLKVGQEMLLPVSRPNPQKTQ